MSDLIYVYTDENRIIHEISMEPCDYLLQCELYMIVPSKAPEVIKLYNLWKRNANIKKNKFVLYDEDGIYNIKKTFYVYYHFKEKTISSIVPRKQQIQDDDDTLKCGLVIVDELITEFINGTKNMLNYKINDDNSLLVMELIQLYGDDVNFYMMIPLIGDYIVSEINNESIIDISYIGSSLTISTVVERDTNHHMFTHGTEYQFFVVDSIDKSILYYSFTFNFTDNRTIYTELMLPHNSMIISTHNKIMKFIRTDNND